METSLDKGIQGKEAKKVLPTLHKTPPNGTIGGVFVCGGKSLKPLLIQKLALVQT